jgi:hypothetical protein
LRVETDFQDVRWIPSKGHLKDNKNLSFLYEKLGWTAIDGWIDSTPSVVIPEHKRLLDTNEGTFSATRGFPFDKLAAKLEKSLTQTKPEGIAADARLSLAIDLYASSRHEETQRGRLVTLVTALEALVDPNRLGGAPATVLKKLVDEAKRLQSETEADEKEEVARLLDRLQGLKRESIKQSLRRLAAKEAETLGQNPTDFADLLATAYDVRSQLLHTGKANHAAVSASGAWLAEWVPRILGAVADRVAKPG